jgi:tetratricopeptide (TPR) repeat protein
MAFEGELKDLSLGEIFQTIAQNRHTGTLTLGLERAAKARLFFREGRIALFSPDDTAGPPFAEILRRSGAIPDGALGGTKGGKSYLRLPSGRWQALEPAEHRGAAERYLADAVADVFRRADKGRFQFQDGGEPRGAFDRDLVAAGAALDPQQVVFEGLRRQDTWPRVKRQIRSFADVFVVRRELEAEEANDLSVEARKLYALLDGSRSLEECMAFLPCGEFGTGQALVDLLERHLVELARADDLGARAREAEQAGDLERAERLYWRALEVERGNVPLREALIALFERSGRPKEAARERMLLGASRAADGDLAGAITEYRRVAELLPADTAALERVFEIELERKDEPGAREAGKRLAERYAAIRLADRARDLLADLARRFPGDEDLRGRHADALAAAGDKLAAAAAWRQIGAAREAAGDEPGALAAFDRALAHMPEDIEARARAEAIRSGKKAARKAAAARARRTVVLVLVLALLGGALVREGLAIADLHGALVKALEAPAADGGAGTRADLARVADAHPFTLAGLEARRLADAVAARR